jgi:hypothetical protein
MHVVFSCENVQVMRPGTQNPIQSQFFTNQRFEGKKCAAVQLQAPAARTPLTCNIPQQQLI